MTGPGAVDGSAADADAGRWDALEEDLAGQVDASRVAERRWEAVEAGRAEVAAVALVDRLRAGVGREVVVVVRGCGPVRGTLVAVGRDWVRLEQGPRESLLALVAVLSVGGLGSQAESPHTGSLVDRRLGLAAPLRRLARDRSAVRVVLDTGDVLHGTVDAVGADHLDLAEHAPGEPRRRSAVVDRRVVPLQAVAAVVRG